MTNNQKNAMLSRHYSLPTGKALLGKKLLAFLFVVLSTMLSTSAIYAQAPTETVYKDWLRAAESANHVDVSTRIVKCDENSPAQVQLFIFNEGSSNPVINMNVTIVNNDGAQSFSTNVIKNVEKGTMIQPTCESNAATDGLKISLPEGYNPSNLTVTVTFN